MVKKDLSTEVLIQIRDELHSNGEEVKRTNEKLDRMREELSMRIEHLEKRQIDSEVRLATELVAVAGGIKDLTRLVAEDRNLRNQVADLQARVGQLERKTG